MSEIIVADLVPLRERGNFAGIIGAVSNFPISEAFYL